MSLLFSGPHHEPQRELHKEADRKLAAEKIQASAAGLKLYVDELDKYNSASKTQSLFKGRMKAQVIYYPERLTDLILDIDSLLSRISKYREIHKDSLSLEERLELGNCEDIAKALIMQISLYKERDIVQGVLENLKDSPTAKFIEAVNPRTSHGNSASEITILVNKTFGPSPVTPTGSEPASPKSETKAVPPSPKSEPSSPKSEATSPTSEPTSPRAEIPSSSSKDDKTKTAEQIQKSAASLRDWIDALEPYTSASKTTNMFLAKMKWDALEYDPGKLSDLCLQIDSLLTTISNYRENYKDSLSREERRALDDCEDTAKVVIMQFALINNEYHNMLDEKLAKLGDSPTANIIAKLTSRIMTTSFDAPDQITALVNGAFGTKAPSLSRPPTPA